MIVSAGYVGDFSPLAPIYVAFNSVDSIGRPAVIAGPADVAVVRHPQTSFTTEDCELDVNIGNIAGLNRAQVFCDQGLANGEYTIVMVGGHTDCESVDGQVVASFSVGRS